jgi:hypothetical protein
MKWKLVVKDSLNFLELIILSNTQHNLPSLEEAKKGEKINGIEK